MRIALSGLVNDFFARDHSVTNGSRIVNDVSGAEDEISEDEEQTSSEIDRQYYQKHQTGIVTQSPMSISSLVTSRSPTSPVIASSSSTLTPVSRPSLYARSVSISTPPLGTHREPPLPHALHALLPVSSYTLPNPVTSSSTHPSSSGFSPSAAGNDATQASGPSERRSLAPANSIFSAIPRGGGQGGPDLHWELGPGNGMGWLARVPAAAATSDVAAVGRGGNGSGIEGNNGPWHGPSQATRVWKATGRSRDLFNGGVSRGRQAQRQRQLPSHSRLSVASSSKENDASSEWENFVTTGKTAATTSAVGRAACPRHLRETDECPRTCIHATHFASQLAPSSTATTTIGAGLSRAGLPLRRPAPATLLPSSVSISRSRSRSRSVPRPAAPAPAPSTLNGKAPARTPSLSPVISTASLGGASNSKRSQSPSKNGRNAKNIQKQREKRREEREKKRRAQAQAKANAATLYGETPMVDVLPRFLRFSALIAKELGREARETGEQRVVDVPTYSAAPAGIGSTGAASGSPVVTTSSSVFESSSSTAPGNSGRSSFPSTEKSYHRLPQHGKETVTGVGSGAKTAPVPVHLQPSTMGDARPTRAWYALLCGIVTRAVLEGYIRGQWKGADPLEVLFGLGLGTTIKMVLKEEKIPLPLDREAMSKNTVRASSNSKGAMKKTTKQDVVMRSGESESESEDSHGSFSSSAPSSSDDDGETTQNTSMSPSYVVDPTVFEPDDIPSLEEAVFTLFDRGLAPQSHVTLGSTSTSWVVNNASSPTSLSSPSRSTLPATCTSKFSFQSIVHSFGDMACPGTSGTDPDWEWETSERISEVCYIIVQSNNASLRNGC
jgi:hypothetical protein